MTSDPPLGRLPEDASPVRADVGPAVSTIPTKGTNSERAERRLLRVFICASLLEVPSANACYRPILRRGAI